MDYGSFSSTLFLGIGRALKEEIDRYTAMVLGEFAVRLTLVINIERGSSSGAVALTDLATDHLETRRKLGLQLNNFTDNTQRRAPSPCPLNHGSPLPFLSPLQSTCVNAGCWILTYTASSFKEHKGNENDINHLITAWLLNDCFLFQWTLKSNTKDYIFKDFLGHYSVLSRANICNGLHLDSCWWWPLLSVLKLPVHLVPGGLLAPLGSLLTTVRYGKSCTKKQPSKPGMPQGLTHILPLQFFFSVLVLPQTPTLIGPYLSFG